MFVKYLITSKFKFIIALKPCITFQALMIDYFFSIFLLFVGFSQLLRKVKINSSKAPIGRFATRNHYWYLITEQILHLKYYTHIRRINNIIL